ncbi:hypothetical protein WICMUC_002220 [Wickerhamomyces mucosus]|uniref:Uncharacterized protein n=1 Tax=Wickerhamomyces mucosus TaxID=1378264 RepID=A0A9P8PR05_9ASCO|nr:hypothetical protein WICMUC_002220 [Wickerhamomyces mucosus]
MNVDIPEPSTLSSRQQNSIDCTQESFTTSSIEALHAGANSTILPITGLTCAGSCSTVTDSCGVAVSLIPSSTFSTEFETVTALGSELDEVSEVLSASSSISFKGFANAFDKLENAEGTGFCLTSSLSTMDGVLVNKLLNESLSLPVQNNLKLLSDNLGIFHGNFFKTIQQ